MDAQSSAQKLADQARFLVAAAKKAGADHADAVVVRSRSSNVSVRLGKVEATEASESDDFSLRVFVGKRIASISASANKGADPVALAERAVAMAKVSPEDAYEGLADPARLAKKIADLDLFDPTQIDAKRMTADALAMEEAARAVSGVTNSGGATASAGLGGMVLVTSGGFEGFYTLSRFGRSVSAIAGEGTAMERDYDMRVRLHFADLPELQDLGRTAGERAVRRLNARKLKTGTVNVMFDPRIARGMAGHIAGAINGASVARKSSFLKDKMGQQVLSKGISITDDPLRLRGSSSRPFDGEGIAGEKLTMIENGVLKHWFLSGSTARELGMETNGRGVRSGSTVVPSSTNLVLEAGDRTPEELMKELGSGFYVTEVFGQGVDMITGQYSRGASGFWIENGELTYPVSEVTIASNLKDMFMNMTAANDLDRSYGTAAPTLVIEGMTLAGE
ncbi:TldD/PmbA family protein [Pseudochrobactrum kiredjianiae]|uniref:TldD/PmbA family protein n=1 Tax=Pseudochrobactrum kiredjianiae TaxID=386305 RepID=A0ABW3V825_9HYPH|nr:TldD/PmbA family protein [Pseudochrobactrum kiredjianiae]MDM7850293.1 TldD/PmbA family protein [Pseudochrobactrum kiredjianiae]